MMTRLKSIREFTQTNLYTLLAVVVVVVLTIAYIGFYVSAIDPGLANRSRLETQLDNARKQLVAAQSVQQEPAETWQTRVADARATLANSMNAFLTADQSLQTVDMLYQYARASGVTIIDLQVPPTPTALPMPTLTPTRLPTPLPSPTSLTGSAATPPSQAQSISTQPAPPSPTRLQTASAQPTNDLFYVRAIRLSARGTTRQLVDFASRLREANTSGVVVNSFNILGNEATPQAILTMDVSLYVLLGTSGTPGAPAPAPNPAPPTYATPMPVIPSMTPSATSVAGALTLTLTPALTPTPTSKVTATWTPTPTPVLAPSPTPKYVIYVVQAGDTLFSLARRYGTTVEAIMSLNHLSNSNIRVGQELLIPAP